MSRASTYSPNAHPSRATAPAFGIQENEGAELAPSCSPS